MAVVVEVDEIGAGPFRDLQQPIAGAIDVVPRIIHPFELVGAFKQPHVLAFEYLLVLLATEARAHAGQCDFNPVRLESTCKLECVSPHTADWIGSHQDAPRQRATNLRFHKLNRELWRLRPSSRCQDQTWDQAPTAASIPLPLAQTIRLAIRPKSVVWCRRNAPRQNRKTS